MSIHALSLSSFDPVLAVDLPFPLEFFAGDGATIYSLCLVQVTLFTLYVTRLLGQIAELGANNERAPAVAVNQNQQLRARVQNSGANQSVPQSQGVLPRDDAQAERPSQSQTRSAVPTSAADTGAASAAETSRSRAGARVVPPVSQASAQMTSPPTLGFVPSMTPLNTPMMSSGLSGWPPLSMSPYRLQPAKCSCVSSAVHPGASMAFSGTQAT